MNFVDELQVLLINLIMGDFSCDSVAIVGVMVEEAFIIWALGMGIDVEVDADVNCVVDASLSSWLMSMLSSA